MSDVVYLVIDEHGVPNWFPTKTLANYFISVSSDSYLTEVHRVVKSNIENEMWKDKDQIKTAFDFYN